MIPSGFFGRIQTRDDDTVTKTSTGRRGSHKQLANEYNLYLTTKGLLDGLIPRIYPGSSPEQLVLQRISGLDLFEFCEKYPHKIILTFVLELTLAMAQFLSIMHDVLHKTWGDISPENVMVSEPSQKHIMIDFGTNAPVGTVPLDHPIKPLYSAPETMIEEMRNTSSYMANFDTTQCDLWSAGATLLFVITGTSPNLPEVFNSIQEGTFETFLLNESKKATALQNDTIRTILVGLLQLTPSERMPAREVAKKVAAIMGYKKPGDK